MVALIGVRIVVCQGEHIGSYDDVDIDVLQYVDLHIGTGGTGYGVGGSPPGAQQPFGCIRASPDTSDVRCDAVVSGVHFYI